MNKENNSYIRLKDIGTIVTGKTPKTSIKDNFGNEFPFITPTDIPTYEEKIINVTERELSALGANEVKSKKLPPNTVCFVCIGSTIGKMCMTDRDSYTNQQINSIIVNKKYNPNYVFYLLKYYRGYFQAIGGGSGSGKEIISKTTFEKIKIPFNFDRTIQDKIASVLITYDELINNNNKRILLLNKASEKIFYEWFVRFRFPNYQNFSFHKTNIGNIPNGFDIDKMDSVINYNIGGGWGNDEQNNEFSQSAYVIRGTDFPNVSNGDLSTCPLRFHKTSNYTTRKLQEGDIILEVSGGTEEQPVGRTLYIDEEIINRFNNQVICASFCKLLRLNKKKVLPLYYYYWMQYIYNARIIDRFQLQSTGIINFKFEYFLKKCDIILPPMELMLMFESKVSSIRKEIMNISKKNEILKQEKQLIFTRVMNGDLIL